MYFVIISLQIVSERLKYMANTWQIVPLELELAVLWKISRGQATHKTNFLVTNGSFRSEIAPNRRYGETPEVIQNECEKFYKLGITNLKQWDEVSDQFVSSFAYAIESILVNKEAFESGKSLYDYLQISPIDSPVSTSYTIPIMDISEVKTYVAKYQRFKSLKLKIDAQSGAELLSEVLKYTNTLVRVDGNECFSDPETYLRFIEKFNDPRIEFMEEPFKAGSYSMYEYVKKHHNLPLIADESVLKNIDWSNISKSFHGINIKLMKSAGLRNAVSSLKKARSLGLKTMIGCMIESSLAISHALQLTSLTDYQDLDGHILLKNEPFNLVTESDGNLSLKPTDH